MNENNDQDQLLAELEKENKILEEELEMIMKSNMPNRNISRSQRSNNPPSEIKNKNLQRIDEEEIYAYSNSECDNVDDSYEEEEATNSLYNHHLNQKNQNFRNNQSIEEVQRRQPQPIPQDSMKLINSLFEHSEQRDNNNNIQMQSPNSGSALLYSPISSMKKTKSVPKGLTQNHEYSQQGNRSITPQNGRNSYTERHNSQDNKSEIQSTKQNIQQQVECNLNDKFKNFDNCENIMGMSNRGDQLDQNDETSRNLQQSLNPKTTGRQSQNSPKRDKIQSLEMRLSGTQKAVKELEKQIRAKDLQIKELNLEILKKNKEIEKLTITNSIQQSMNSQSTKNLQMQTSISDYVKKEKQLEKKIKDQDLQIIEMKKSQSRVQEVNSSLLLKIKELEKDLEISKQSKGNTSSSNNENNNNNTNINSNSTNHNTNENLELRKKIKYLEKCLEEKDLDYDYLQKQHETLIELSTEHLIKADHIHDAYNNISQIISSKY